MKRELAEVNQELSDVKTKLRSSEAKFEEVMQELAVVQSKLSKCIQTLVVFFKSEASYHHGKQESADKTYFFYKKIQGRKRRRTF